MHHVNWPPSIADGFGTAGTMTIVIAYFLTQTGRMNSNDVAFPVLNLVGSVLISVSLLESFNWASALMEVFWIAISLWGLARALRGPDAPTPPPA